MREHYLAPSVAEMDLPRYPILSGPDFLDHFRGEDGSMKYGFEDLVEVNLRKSLRAELSRRKAKNPRYSMRAFARDLGTSHPALSEIMAGKRKISRKLLDALIERMKLPESEKSSVRRLQETRPHAMEQLSVEEIRQLAHWYYPAILELTLTRNFKSDPAWIAARLGLNEEDARQGVQHLLDCGQLKKTRGGRLVATNQNTTTLGQLEARQILVEQLCQQTERQLNALKNLPVEACSMMGLTVAMDPRDLPEVRRRIYDFIQELANSLDASARRSSEVFRLNIGFFPLTRTQSDAPPA